MKKLGLIVNPIAGMGGAVGLKGTDGAAIQAKARELGAKPQAPRRTHVALAEIVDKRDEFELYTAPAEMGQQVAEAEGFVPVVIGDIAAGTTTSADTIAIAKEMVERGVNLLIFAGGDGTARNVCEAVDLSIPVLGIPAGVKIHSAVYANNPKSAGKAIAAFLAGQKVTFRDSEVMDIDEDEFRRGNVKARLYGYMRVPEIKTFMQSVKSGGYSEQNELLGLAAYVAEGMKENVLYAVGTGTTTRAVMDHIGVPNTLLGVDLIMNRKLIAADVTEAQLYDLVKGREAYAVVTVIGGQGHILGRGNQQFSPRVLREIGKDHIIIAATRKKLLDIHPDPLHVDTGDEVLDAELSGWVKVVTGYGDTMMAKLEA